MILLIAGFTANVMINENNTFQALQVHLEFVNHGKPSACCASLEGGTRASAVEPTLK